MSSGKTHMVIGAAAGLGLARMLELNGYHLASFSGGRYMAIVVLAGTSAFCATLPDIDEQNSFIARRARVVITMMTAILLAIMGWMVATTGTGIRGWEPVHVAGLGGILGVAVVGPLLGTLILRMIRVGAGGHRRLTHSGVVAGLFAIIAYVLWVGDHEVWAIIPGALAWSIIIHDLGDIVTPDGLPLLYPLSTRRFGLPRPLSTIGEPLAFGAALFLSAWLVQGM